MTDIMKTLRTIFLSILMCMWLPVSATCPIVRNYSKSDYGAGTQNWAVAQNGGGVIYFANNFGVVEFDGKQWRTYPVKNRTVVRSLFYDRSTERLYAGATDEFGYFSLDEAGWLAYTSLSYGNDTKGPLEEIWKIYSLDGILHLQNNSEIILYHDGLFTHYSAGMKIDCSAMVHGVLIVATADRISMFSGEQFIRMKGTEVLAGKKIVSILSPSPDTVYFITEKDGIFAYDWDRARKIRTSLDRILTSKVIYCASAVDRYISFGTVTDGVYILDTARDTYFHINADSGLQNNTVLSMMPDKDRNLWLGLDKGIDYIALNSPELSLFSSSLVCGAGYASLPDGDRLLLGTNQGLFQVSFDQEKGIIGDNPEKIKGLDGQVWNLVRIDGTIFCSHDSGLYIIKGNTAEKIPGIRGVWKVTELKTRKGIVLGSSYDGFFTVRKTGGKWILDKQIKGCDDDSGMFEEDRDGKIWFYRWMKGLFRLTLTEECDSVSKIEYFGTNAGLPSNNNNLVNRLGNEIIFSSDNGYWKYDYNSGRMIPAEEINSMFTVLPKAVSFVESPSGDLYFMSGGMDAIAFRDNGSWNVDSLSLKYMRNKRIFGFEKISWPAPDSFIINTDDGFSVFDIDDIRSGSSMAENGVFIKEISVKRENRDSVVFGSRSATYTSGPDFELPYKYNSLQITYISPYFENNESMSYSYMLEGYDKEWSEFSNDNVKEYTRLPHGRYTFRVKSRYSQADECSETSVDFTIRAPWYGSTLAYCIYSVFAALLLYFILQLIKMRSMRLVKAMEAKKEEEIMILKNQTLEHDLKHKSQDLASSTMNLLRKNEILLKIKDGIDLSIRHFEDDEKNRGIRELQKLKYEIMDNIEHDDDWKKFEQNFDVVYEDYLNRLGKKYPSLSIGDKKICAYLKMGLSSKDIAPLMNMSVHSVEMARYRLRKKLELDRSVNLSEFLQNF